MSNDDLLQDLSHIRSLMERSTKFISISGLSGILAGTYTLIATAFLWWKFKITWLVFGTVDAHMQMALLSPGDAVRTFTVTGAALLALSLGTGIFLALQKAGRAGRSAWNPASKSMLSAVAAPLLTGGGIAVLALLKGQYLVLAPSFLVFYGLALYAGSYFSFKELRVLGTLEVILGLLACWYLPLGLLFFAVGFGLLHVLYGAIIIKKYGA